MSWPPLWVTGGPPVWCLLKSNVVYSRCGRYTTSPVRSLWGWLPFTSGMGMSECALVQRALAAALVKLQGRIMAGPFPKGKTSKGCNYQKMGKHWIKQNQQTFLNWSLRVCVCVCEREQGRERNAWLGYQDLVSYSYSPGFQSCSSFYPSSIHRNLN